MKNPAPPFNTSRLAERIAWMHEPVHLSCAFLPWFVLRMLENALHGYLCTLEQGLLLLMELQEQGQLALWSEEAACHQRRPAPKYKMKFAPAAPQRAVGCSAAPQSSEPQSAPAMDAAMASAPCRSSGGLQRLALPEFAAAPRSLNRQIRPTLGDAWGLIDRCRRSTFCKPAWAVWDNCAQIISITQRNFRLIS